MRILIIEDEKPAAIRLQRLLQKHFPDADIYQNIDSIKSAIHWFNNNTKPDLLFLDIQLADGLSFEIFKQVKVDSPVIFCTAYDQYAIKAFDLNSVDYLLKPIDPQDLDKAIVKYQERFQDKGDNSFDFAKLESLLNAKNQDFKERFVVKVGDKIKAIPTVDIAFFYSENRATFAQDFNGKSYLIDFSLDQLLELLNPKKFYRLNRRYIACFDSIEDMRAYSNSRLKLILKNCGDRDILMSREKLSDFKKWLDQ